MMPLEMAAVVEWSGTTQVQILALPPTHQLRDDSKSFDLFEPQFSHLYNEDMNTCPLDCREN